MSGKPSTNHAPAYRLSTLEVADSKGNFFTLPAPVFEVFRQLADDSSLGLRAAKRHGALWMNEMMELSLEVSCKETVAAYKAGNKPDHVFRSGSNQVRGTDGRWYTVPGELISTLMVHLGFAVIIRGARIKYGAAWPSYL